MRSTSGRKILDKNSATTKGSRTGCITCNAAPVAINAITTNGTVIGRGAAAGRDGGESSTVLLPDNRPNGSFAIAEHIAAPMCSPHSYGGAYPGHPGFYPAHRAASLICDHDTRQSRWRCTWLGDRTCGMAAFDRQAGPRYQSLPHS